MPRQNVAKDGGGIGRRLTVVVVGMMLLASACSSGTEEPSASAPKAGSGAQEEALSAGEGGTLAKAGTFILEGLASGVLEGVGTMAFNWVAGLISPDKTPQQLDDIQKGVEQLEQNVQQLTTEVDSMRSTMDQDFKNQQGLIQDQGLAQDRTTIDDATVKLQTYAADTKRAIADGTPLPKVNDYIGEYGDPRDLSNLYNLLDHDLNTALTVGGSNTGGGSLIGSADAIFSGLESQAEAAKTAAAFDDRPLWQRLGLPATATPADITKACDDLRAAQPSSAVCAAPGASSAVANVSYYDRMQTFIDYYVNYQVNGLLVATTALYAWDDDGTCPVPAQGDCAVATERAQELTIKVVENVRQQMAMAGSPVSTNEQVLETGPGDTAALWSTSVASARYAQTPPSVPPNGWTDWRVPIDCSLSGQVTGTDRPDEGIPCADRNNPYVVTVPGDASAQVCVGAPAIGTDVAAKGGGNGVWAAVPGEWAACVRPEGAPATGLRVPTNQEMATALPKKPDTWVASLGDPTAETVFGSGTYLSASPAQVVCGNPLGEDETENFIEGTYSLSAINANPNRWVNGLTDTWTNSGGWKATGQYKWVEPLVLAFNSSGHQPEPTYGYPADGPCERVFGDMGTDGHADHLLPRGFVQCVKNPSLVRDWCYGHRNYKGNDLPTSGQKLQVWAVKSLVACPSQKVDAATGSRPAAWQATGCEPDQRPSGKDWEVPACKTPAGRWTLCGTSWVDDILAPPPPMPAPTTTTTTTAPSVTTTEVDPPPTSAPVTTVPVVPTTVAPAPTTTTGRP